MNNMRARWWDILSWKSEVAAEGPPTESRDLFSLFFQADVVDW